MSIKPLYNVRDYAGCDPTGATYSDAAFLAALNDRASYAAPTIYGAGVPPLYIPAGNYKLRTTLRITRSGLIYGDGLAASVITWDDGMDGVVFESGFTAADGGASTFTVFRDLGILSAGQWSYTGVNFQPPRSPMPIIDADDPLTTYPPNQGHPYWAGSGLVLFARVTIERCRLGNWKYDAIHVQSDDIADDGTTLYNHKNVNGWRVVGCRIEGGGRHGLYLMGENANVGKAEQNDIWGCGGWGIYDRAFLGNLHEANQIAECRQGSRYTPSGVAAHTFVAEYSEADNQDSIGSPGLCIGGTMQNQPLTSVLDLYGLRNVAVKTPVTPPYRIFVRTAGFGGSPNAFQLFSASTSDHTIYLDATNGYLELVIPSADQAASQQFAIKRTDATQNLVWVIALDRTGIDGVDPLTLAPGEAIVVESDGHRWRIISRTALASAGPQPIAPPHRTFVRQAGFGGTPNAFQLFSASTTDHTLYLDATHGYLELVVPSADQAASQQFAIKRIDATQNLVWVIAQNRAGIDGTDPLVQTAGQGLLIQSDGQQWRIISRSG